MCKTDQVQFIGYSTDDGLVSEVEMKPLKIHLPVNPLITVRLRVREMKKSPINKTHSKLYTSNITSMFDMPTSGSILAFFAFLWSSPSSFESLRLPCPLSVT